VSGNTAIYGGAGIFSYNTGSSVTLSDTIVSGNTAPLGAGIANYFGGSVLLTDSIVSGNIATVVGGGVFTFAGGTVTLTGTSTIVDNTPDNCYPPGSVAGCTG
jgi:hypothetical protein